MKENRKLNTILFADIAGYTSLMQNDEVKAMGLLKIFKNILEDHVPKFEGHIVQYFGTLSALVLSIAQFSVPLSRLRTLLYAR